MEIISQTFKGVIPPTRIDHNNGDGRIVSIVDWADIADKHRPSSGENVQFEFEGLFVFFLYFNFKKCQENFSKQISRNVS